MDVIGAAIESDLKRNGIAREQAEVMAFSACMAVQRDVGGSQVYISKACSKTVNKRNQEIVAAFHEGNYRELANRFKLSERRIRQILENDLKARRASRPLNTAKWDLAEKL